MRFFGKPRLLALLVALSCFFVCFLICSCDGGASSDSEEEPDIRLNSTHCVISESDQEPIVIDAEVLELYSETDTVVMRNVIFRQNKKDSDRVGIAGTAGYLNLDSKNQDVHLADGVELFIYPDDDDDDGDNASKPAVEVSESGVDSILADSQPDNQEMDDIGLSGDADGNAAGNSIADAPANENPGEDANASMNGASDKNASNANEENPPPMANRIQADEIVWGKYSKMLESPKNVSLEWEGTVIRGTGFKGNLNTGEFSFESVEEGRL